MYISPASSNQRQTVSSSKGPRIRLLIVVLLTATLAALINSLRNIVGSVTNNRPIDWWWAVMFEFTYWYVWAALTPLILWFAGRFDLERIRRTRVILLLIAFGLLIAPLQSIAEWGVALGIVCLRHVPKNEFAAAIKRAEFGIMLGSISNTIIYSVIIAGHYGYDYYRRYRERQLCAAELEGKLFQAELQNLKMQLQPHFLFNTLNTISVLMMRDPVSANRTLVQLSDLLRLSLDSVGLQHISLKQELDFLNRYLEIEQTRFQDRLTIERHIDPATLDAAVPNLILQPLVENAIRHGVAKQPGNGTVEIRAKRIAGNLRIDVLDNGPGLHTNGSSQPKGLGLQNTRARLQQLYGEKHSFELKNAPKNGVIASLTIPFSIYERQ
jgi:two-component system, LytTR family, sensor kinase